MSETRGPQVRRSMRERLAALKPPAQAPLSREAPDLERGSPPQEQGFLAREDRHLPIDGQLCGTDGAWVRRVEYALDHDHGRFSLAAALEADPRALARAGKCPELAEVPLRHAVFFDTETTSLSGGAGIYLFLIGLGFVEGSRFVVEQYFLRDVAHETAMLQAVRQRLDGAQAVVSFAGKSFDHPRLTDRLVLCGLHGPACGTPGGDGEVIPKRLHLDLLHPARALWRTAYPDVRLSTLERERLGCGRKDDLPGALCPMAYFDYLRGRPGLLPGVFEHNLLDVLSLVTLAAEVANSLANPRSAHERLGAARLHEAAGDLDAACLQLEAARGQLPRGHVLRGQATCRLAALTKRAGDRSAACALWEELAEHPEHAATALEELARALEHHQHDLPAAIAATRRALTALRASGDRRRRRVREAALARRLGRLERKLDRFER